MTNPQAARETLRPDPLTPEPMTFGALTFDVDPSHDWGNLFCADCGRWPDEDGSTVPCPGPSWRTAAERAARQEAADTSGLRADVLYGFPTTYTEPEAAAWVAGVRAALAAGATERPLDVDRLTGFLVQAALHEGQHGDFPSIRAQAEWMASEWNDPRSITNLRLAHYAARLSPATATPEAGDA